MSLYFTTEGAALAAVLISLWAFGLGCRSLIQRFMRESSGYDPVLSGALGILCLLTVVTMLGLTGLPALWPGAVVFQVVSLLGLWQAGCRLKHGPSLKALDWRDLAQKALIIAAALYAGKVWMTTYWDLLGLPSIDDGIAHTTFFLRLLGSGLPTSGLVPLSFPREFGHEYLVFYPTGTHALMVLATGWLAKAGWLAPSDLLKAWLTFCDAGSPFLLMYMVRRLIPRLPWLIALLVLVLASTYFRFPFWASDSGGLSRIGAYVVVWAVVPGILDRTLSWRMLHALAIFGLPAAYMLHPGALFVLFAALSYGWLIRLPKAARARAARFGSFLAAGLAGAGMIGLIALANPANNVSTTGTPVYGALMPFSWPAVLERLGSLLYAVGADEFLPLQPWHWSASQPLGAVLAGLGVLALAVAARRLRLPASSAFFPLFMAAIGCLLMTLCFVPSDPIRFIGMMFYHQADRVAEIFYLPIGLLWAFGGLGLWRLAEALPGRSRPWRAASAAVGIALLGLALYQHKTAMRGLQNHMGYWLGTYTSPRKSHMGQLADFVEKHLPEDAVLLYRPRSEAYVFEAKTGRKGIFIYHECPTSNAGANCAKRSAIVSATFQHVAQATQTEAAKPCLGELAVFSSPVYLLVNEAEFPRDRPVVGLPLCADATTVGLADHHYVIRYDGIKRAITGNSSDH